MNKKRNPKHNAIIRRKSQFVAIIQEERKKGRTRKEAWETAEAAMKWRQDDKLPHTED